MLFVLFGELQILILETSSSVQLNRTSGTVLKEKKKSPLYPKVLGRAHLVLPGDRARATPPVALESSKLQSLKRSQKAPLSFSCSRTDLPSVVALDRDFLEHWVIHFLD